MLYYFEDGIIVSTSFRGKRFQWENDSLETRVKYNFAGEVVLKNKSKVCTQRGESNEKTHGNGIGCSSDFRVYRV